jgi:hypothetical protein
MGWNFVRLSLEMVPLDLAAELKNGIADKESACGKNCVSATTRGRAALQRRVTRDKSTWASAPAKQEFLSYIQLRSGPARKSLGEVTNEAICGACENDCRLQVTT